MFSSIPGHTTLKKETRVKLKGKRRAAKPRDHHSDERNQQGLPAKADTKKYLSDRTADWRGRRLCQCLPECHGPAHAWCGRCVDSNWWNYWLLWFVLSSDPTVYVFQLRFLLAAMGAAFTLTESFVANQRQTDDPWNGASGACAAGFLAGIKGGTRLFNFDARLELF